MLPPWFLPGIICKRIEMVTVASNESSATRLLRKIRTAQISLIYYAHTFSCSYSSISFATSFGSLLNVWAFWIDCSVTFDSQNWVDLQTRVDCVFKKGRRLARSTPVRLAFCDSLVRLHLGSRSSVWMPSLQRLPAPPRYGFLLIRNSIPEVHQVWASYYLGWETRK